MSVTAGEHVEAATVGAGEYCERRVAADDRDLGERQVGLLNALMRSGHQEVFTHIPHGLAQTKPPGMVDALWPYCLQAGHQFEPWSEYF